MLLLLLTCLLLSVARATGQTDYWVPPAGERLDERNCQTHPWPHNNTLLPGESLYRGGHLESAKASLVFDQATGNIILMKKRTMEILWESGTGNTSAAVLTLRHDGNLVILSENQLIMWQSATTNATILVVQDNCRMVLYAKPPVEDELWASNEPMCITAHITMHSHDDVGWLLTPEQYSNGCDAPTGGTEGIFTTMMEALTDNPMRKFSEVEMYFFQRWWKKQNETVRDATRQLVANGQLEFINAGWSMHDEACVHQESAISNMEIGAHFLRDTFGDSMNLTIGWHIDPFGHASTTPRIMAQMGFDAFFFWRTDYEQADYMKRTKTLESMWHSSPNLGRSVEMFTSIMFNDYCMGCQNMAFPHPWGIMCPSPFYSMDCMAPTPWDPWGQSGSQAIFHAMKLEAMSVKNPGQHISPQEARTLGYPAWLPPVQELAWGYVQTIRWYESFFRTGHVLMPWGCDFQHENAHLSFQLMDAIVAEINSNSTYGMEVKYSNPSEYVKAVKDMNYKWPRNDFDYFLDSDNGHAYWSGYLSSRAEYKGYERFLMNQRTAVELALSACQLHGANLNREIERVTWLREAMGIAQHHDSITGTERVNVREQYQFILSRAAHEADLTLMGAIENATHANVTNCVLRNLSSCAATAVVSPTQNVSAFIFNPLSRNRTEFITIPVPTSSVTVILRGAHGMETVLTTEVTPTWELTTTEDISSPEAPALPYQATVEVHLAPLQLLELVITGTAVAGYSHLIVPQHVNDIDSFFNITNGLLTAEFDPVRKQIASVSRHSKSGTTFHPLQQNILTYCPHNASYMSSHDRSTQGSGAYIFRTCHPDESAKPYAEYMSGVSVLRGPLCEEVRQYIDNTSNVQQAWRLCRGMQYIELVAGIGEVDIRATGVEVILRVWSQVNSSGTWYTDSQALEMQKRVRNQRPNYPYTVTEPIAANFFPCNAFAFLNGTHNPNSNLAVVADRSRATASLYDGELEFLVQRRLAFDDYRGVAQNLNETTRVLTVNRIIVDSETLTADVRFNSLLHTHQPIVRFGSRAAIPAPYSAFALPDSATLPASIHLHTRSILSEGRLLVRLQHLFARDEAGASEYAHSEKVDIKSVLPIGATLDSVEEYDLNGITKLRDVKRHDFLTCDPNTGVASPVPQVAPSLQPGTTTVLLHPMDIRTFIVRYHF